MIGILFPESSESLLLNELLPDILPGKPYWITESNKNFNMDSLIYNEIITKSIDVNQIGVKKATKNTQNTTKSMIINKNDDSYENIYQLGNRILKKLGILSVKNLRQGIIVELLNDSQSNYHKSDYNIRIYCQRLLNPSNLLSFKPIMSPIWPPIAIDYQMSVALIKNQIIAVPTLISLKTKLSNEFNILIDNLIIYKYYRETCNWIDWTNGITVTNSSNKKKTTVSKVTINQKKKNINNENILEAPYNLKESDLFCIFDKNDIFYDLNDISNNDNQITKTTPNSKTSIVSLNTNNESSDCSVIILRDEDKIGQKNIKDKNLKKLNKGKSTIKKKSLSLAPRPEVMLSLGGNLDFSDEEDDFDN